MCGDWNIICINVQSSVGTHNDLEQHWKCRLVKETWTVELLVAVVVVLGVVVVEIVCVVVVIIHRVPKLATPLAANTLNSV